MKYRKSTMQNQLEELAKRARGRVGKLVYLVQDRIMDTHFDRGDLEENADQIGLTISTLTEAVDGSGETDFDELTECVAQFLAAVGEPKPERLIDFYLRRQRRETPEFVCVV